MTGPYGDGTEQSKAKSRRFFFVAVTQNTKQNKGTTGTTNAKTKQANTNKHKSKLTRLEGKWFFARIQSGTFPRRGPPDTWPARQWGRSCTRPYSTWSRWDLFQLCVGTPSFSGVSPPRLSLMRGSEQQNKTQNTKTQNEWGAHHQSGFSSGVSHFLFLGSRASCAPECWTRTSCLPSWSRRPEISTKQNKTKQYGQKTTSQVTCIMWMGVQKTDR